MPEVVAVKAADHAGNQLHVVEDVAAVHGDIIQLLAGDQVGAFAGVGLQLHLGGFGDDRHFFRGRAYGEGEFAGVQAIGGGEIRPVFSSFLNPAASTVMA